MRVQDERRKVDDVGCVYDMRKLLLILITCAFSISLQAHQPRMKLRASRAFVIGLGRTHQLDTYLSPMEYKGPGFTFLEEYRRVIDWNDNRGTFRSTIQASLSPGHAWKGSFDAIGGDLRYDATWQYHFWIPGLPITFKGGGGFNTTLGGMYTTHDGNNPAQAHAQVQLLGALTAEYQVPLKRSCLARYYAELPLLGGMFSPAYGQSYYEIFSRGNYDHNIVLTHPFRDFSMRQQLWVDISLDRKTRKTPPFFYLRVGYQNEIRQLQPNHLKQKAVNNALLLGIVKHL